MNYIEYGILALTLVVSLVVCVRACKQGKVGPEYGLSLCVCKKKQKK